MQSDGVRFELLRYILSDTDTSPEGGRAISREVITVVEGISFGEAPRWRHGSLYLSDIHANRILRVDPTGRYEVVERFDGPVSGLGWLPDGRMLVVSMHDRKVLRQEMDGQFVVHSDLSNIATWHANDMVVATDGTAYVGNFGFRIFPTREEPRAAAIAKITPSGATRVAATGLWFPNGMVISEDGRTLVVAESTARRLSAFDIAEDGTLVHRRLWGQMASDQLPDGICLDADGAIWIASPPSREVVRMREGGEIVERIALDQDAIACMLGGEDRRTLFMLTAEKRDPEWCRVHHSARVLSTRVEIPGAGLP
jgi:sugar lactone lactonase YvrE